jgi:uncharacterized protein (TIGR02145 family)
MKTKRKYLLSFLATGAIIAFLFSWSCKKEDTADIPKLGNLSISENVDGSAVITGSIEYDGDTELHEFGIVWNTTGTPSLESHEGKSSASLYEGNFTISLTGLLPVTNYYVRGYAISSKDTVYSDQVMFTTPGKLATVTTSGVTEISESSAVSGGEVSYEGGLEVNVRGIVWSTSEIPDIEDNEGITENGSGLGEFTSELTGLSEETTYFVRAYATNSFGTAYGQQEFFKTNPGSNANDGQPCLGMPTFTDPRDGHVYNTVQIGNQCWLTENLKYLPAVYPPSNGSSSEARYYVYGYLGNDISEALSSDNYKNYGVLYNWPAAMNGEESSNANPSGVQGICPAGWSLPSDLDWEELREYLYDEYGIPNTNSVNGFSNSLKSCRQVDSPLGEECTTSDHPRWNSHHTHYGNDQFGFSAFPGGNRNPNTNGFLAIGLNGFWWTSTEASSTQAVNRTIITNGGSVSRGSAQYKLGFSVRCVRDRD